MASLKGEEAVSRRLFAVQTKLMQFEAAAALYAEGVIEMKESMRRTPVKWGALRGSHETEGPDGVLGGNMEVRIVVGGSSAPYAAIVHEDLTAFHKVGQAKFLESTINESKPFLLKRIARRISLGRASR